MNISYRGETMKAKCPYCQVSVNIRSTYNLCRRHGDAGLTATTGYHRCPGCNKVFEYTTGEVKGWEQVTETMALPSKDKAKQNEKGNQTYKRRNIRGC